MTINVNGKEVEAYHLIMQKGNALDIVNGSKHVEVRGATDQYFSRFFNKKKYEAFTRLYEEFDKNEDIPAEKFIENLKAIDIHLTKDDFEDGATFYFAVYNQLFNEVKYIYFTNYNKSWHLVVEVADKKLYELTEETRKLMNEKYAFHDWDGDDLSESLDENGNTWEFFALELGKIIEHKGLVN